MDRWRGLVKDALPWGTLSLFLVVAAFADIGPDLREVLLKWGPGILWFLVLIQYLPDWVRASQKQADALAAMARELQELPRRDEFKFQDLLIGQELVLRELADIKKRMPDGGRAG